MINDIIEKAKAAVEGFDAEKAKAYAAVAAEKLKTAAAGAKEYVSTLDVGEAVVRGHDILDAIKPEKVTNIILDLKNNPKYDGARSMLRSGKDFITNYPRYYIEGLIGSFKNR